MPSMTIEPWVTLKDVAEHLQVSDETIHRWMDTRGLPAHRAGRVWRFKLSEVDQWVRSGEAAAEDGDTPTGGTK
jgi:excisionase family DNA binding protein